MRRLGILLVAALAAALAAPGQGLAVGHLTLYVLPSRVAQPPSPLGAWKLSAAVSRGASPDGRELVGVKLGRSFKNGRAGESHNFYANPAASVTFDGTRGSWSGRFGATLAVRMDIAATGMPTPVDTDRGCRGAFLRVPVSLRGTLVLRTGTRYFKTIRRRRASGLAIFDPAGPVDCAPAPAARCERSSSLFAARLSPTGRGDLIASSDSGGWATLSFVDATAPAWYHVMSVEGLDPLHGALPTITAALPAGFPIRGAGTFTAAATSEEVADGCRTATTTGVLVGVFRARFTGWGARTLRLGAGDLASYTTTG